MHFLPVLITLLSGCEMKPAELATPNSTLVEQVLDIARPEPNLDLPILLRDVAASSTSCPQIDVLEQGIDGGPPARVLLTGDCIQPDGTVVDGSLVLVERADEQWFDGDGFSMSRDGELELFFDGTLETSEHQDLMLVDISASWCGGAAVPCDRSTATVDLSYSIYPAGGYPDTYDVTVSGVVSSGMQIAVEGAWSIDLASCPGEPTDGVFALQQSERHDLILDGAIDCDSCADWTVQGVSVTQFCGVEF